MARIKQIKIHKIKKNVENIQHFYLILENFNLESNNKNYPTIDHKISIKHGFDNNISPEKISSLDNLCITKRSKNSSKGKKIETEFNI